MNAQGQDLKELLLQTDEEFHQLAAKHHELEDRLHELTAKHYLSEPEQVEEVTLKKRKLQLKDRMEDILRRHRNQDHSRQVVARVRETMLIKLLFGRPAKTVPSKRISNTKEYHKCQSHPMEPRS